MASAPPLEPFPPSDPPLLLVLLLVLLVLEDPVDPLEELVDALSPHAESIERTDAHVVKPKTRTGDAARFVNMNWILRHVLA